MNRWEGPLGAFDVEYGPYGLSAVRMSNGVEYAPVDNGLADILDRHLKGLEAGIRLDFQGMHPLAQLTLAKLLEIPRGEVRPYAWVAREIGRPNSVRAVASAIADNPIPLVVPCHRVVRSDGHLGQFGLGGPELKKRLLSFEGLDVDAMEGLAASGVRYLVDARAGYFHYPSCGRATKYSELEGVSSLEEAHERRVESCTRCRP